MPRKRHSFGELTKTEKSSGSPSTNSPATPHAEKPFGSLKDSAPSRLTDVERDEGEGFGTFPLFALGAIGFAFFLWGLGEYVSPQIGKMVAGISGGFGGGGTGLCDSLPSWFCSDIGYGSPEGDSFRGSFEIADIRAATMWLLFIGWLIALVLIFIRFPLLFGWQNHASFYPRILWSPALVLAILAIPNFFPQMKTDLAWIFENPRVFSAYASSLAGMAYGILFRWTAPLEAIKWSKGLHERPLIEKTDFSRPVARYVLAVLAYVFAINSLFLLATLIPSALSIYPVDMPWYKPFMPW